MPRITFKIGSKSVKGISRVFLKSFSITLIVSQYGTMACKQAVDKAAGYAFTSVDNKIILSSVTMKSAYLRSARLYNPVSSCNRTPMEGFS